MPKMKSHSGAKKRFRKTTSGKWTHRKAGRRHLLTGVPSQGGREMRRRGVIVSEQADAKSLKKYLPYD